MKEPEFVEPPQNVYQKQPVQATSRNPPIQAFSQRPQAPAMMRVSDSQPVSSGQMVKVMSNQYRLKLGGVVQVF